MKLATSTGDFVRYSNSLVRAVESIRHTKFRYVNLELDGPQYVEMDAKPEVTTKLLREAAKKTGLIYSTAHAPCLNAFAGDEEYEAKCVRTIRESIEIAGELGIKGIVVHACDTPGMTKEEFYRRNKAFYASFFDLMEKYEVTVMTENTTEADGVLSTGKDMREFADFVGHPLFGVCWDTAHANLNAKAREAGQYACITAIGDRLKGLHIADNFGDGPHHHTFPFAGIINFDAVMQALVNVNYEGFFTFEASYTLLHHTNMPYHRPSWEHDGRIVTKLWDPPVELKEKAVDLLYDIGACLLETYDCFEE